MSTVTSEIGRRLHQEVEQRLSAGPFNCFRCKAWLRERPPLTEKLTTEAFSMNFGRDAHGPAFLSAVGKGPLVDGTLSIQIVERRQQRDDKHYLFDYLESHRYCPDCASVAKDALMQLGFVLEATP